MFLWSALSIRSQSGIAAPTGPPPGPGLGRGQAGEGPMSHRVGVLGAVLLGLLGCAHQGQQTRLQSADDKDAEVKTVGDVTAFANADPIPVAGIGLVVGLDGTGGCPPGPERVFVEEELRRKGVEHVKEVLASKDVALVRVSAQIPAGARKGDPLDVE